MFEFLFYTGNWPPRWRCGKWADWLGWTHITSELLVFGAYMTIPLLLFYFIRKRKDMPFKGVLLLFVIFILSCGFTHLVEAIIFYYPVYRFLGLLLVITALVSWATVFAMIPVLPKILSLPSLANINELLAQDIGLLKNRLQVAVETMHVGVFDWDLVKGTVNLDKSFFHILNQERNGEDLSKDSFLDMVFFEDKVRLQEAFQSHIRDANIVTEQVRFLDNSNQVVSVVMNWKMVYSENNEPKQIIGTVSKA